MKQLLTPKQTKFARHYFEHGNGVDAYRASYDAENMQKSSINAAVTELLTNPSVASYIEQMKTDAEFVAELSVAWVLKQYMQIATADVNELIESRRVCCRYCHGVDFKYQWVSADEWAEELAHVMDSNARLEKSRAQDKPSPRVLPSFDGGDGFHANREPHEGCPHCFGNGSQYTFVHDTRKLKGSAKLLYAGIKQTKDGVQVLMRNQDAALDYLAKYLGIDKKSIELSGPGGKPIQSLSSVTTDPAEAAKIYAATMGGNIT